MKTSKEIQDYIFEQLDKEIYAQRLNLINGNYDLIDESQTKRKVLKQMLKFILGEELYIMGDE
jgi:hypothetical protein